MMPWTSTKRMVKWLAVMAVFALMAPAGFHGVAYSQSTTWTDGNGQWTTAGNWSSGVPNSTTSATINNGSSVTLSGTGTVNNLTIASSNSLTIVDNSNLTIFGSSISNSGNIILAASNNPAQLIIGNANTTLSGTGTVTMSDNTSNLIVGAAGSDTLTNQSTIQGAGNIGGGKMTLVNAGTINANGGPPGGGGRALVIQTSGGTTNTGTIEATGGSTLVLDGTSGGNFTNTSGTIQAVGGGSVVQLQNGVTITGGTLTTSSGGLIFNNNGHTVTLSGLTISTGSNYQVNDSGTTTLVGMITNNGTLSLASAGNTTSLELSGNVTLTGSGNVTMDNNTSNRILGAVGTDVLTNQETIQGAGNIGGGQMTLVNEGTINVNTGVGGGGGRALVIQTSGGTTNTGTIEATGGSLLVLDGISGGNFTNTGGTIQAVGSSSQVQLQNGVTITGGTLTTSGGGLIFDNNGHTVMLSGLTISTGSSYQVNDHGTTILAGTITNNGTITLSAGNNLTSLELSGNVTLTGSGTVTMGNNTLNQILGAVAGDVLTNQETIQGSGNIGAGQMTLVNAGTINANAGPPGGGGRALVIQTSGGTTNTKTIEATNGSTLQLLGGTFTNTGGTIEAIGSGSQLLLTNGVTITNGTLTSSGGGFIDTTGSTLNGVTLSTGSSFTVNDNSATTLVKSLTNNGTLTLAAANNPTKLLISGNVTLSGKGAVVMQDNTNNIIDGVASTAVLTNNSTIEGAGNIGNANMGLVNGTTGVINANQSHTLLINVDTKNFNNQGTLIVAAGSTMQIEGSGSFTNYSSATNTLTGGTYNVSGTLTCNLCGTGTIVTNAATINMSGSGQILNNSNANMLASFATNNGTFSTANGFNFTTAGSFTNNGTLNVGSGTSFVVNLAHSLTNFSSNTLTGGTYIVSGTLQFAGANIQAIATNTSLTMSGSSAKIEDQTGSAVGLTNLATNNGTFATASGFNFTTAGNFTNNGTLNVGSGTSFVVNLADGLTNFSSNTLTGGTYIVSGTLQFAGANIVTIASGTSLTMSGANAKIEDQTGAAVGLANFATNNGTFATASSFNFTTTGSFTNNGTLNIGSGTKFIVNLADSLTNFSAGTLTGGTYIVAGTLQFNGDITTNDASISLTSTAAEIKDGSGNNSLAGFNTNGSAGSFTLSGNANFTSPSSTAFSNAGAITVSKNSKFTVGGTANNYDQTAGTTTVDGTLIVGSSGLVNITAGTLQGAGTITGAVSNGGTITVGDSTAKAGLLSVTGNYTQLSGGAMNAQIGGTLAGTGFSQLKVTGNVTLAGTLNLATIGGFLPKIGQTFTIVTASGTGHTLTGTFATITGQVITGDTTNCPSGCFYAVSYTSTSVVLTVTAGSPPAAPGRPHVPADSNPMAGTAMALIGHKGASRSSFSGHADHNAVGPARSSVTQGPRSVLGTPSTKSEWHARFADHNPAQPASVSFSPRPSPNSLNRKADHNPAAGWVRTPQAHFAQQQIKQAVSRLLRPGK